VKDGDREQASSESSENSEISSRRAGKTIIGDSRRRAAVRRVTVSLVWVLIDALDERRQLSFGRIVPDQDIDDMQASSKDFY
jgi:hypothetical protein